jgi:hydrogenase-4 component B
MTPVLWAGVVLIAVAMPLAATRSVVPSLVMQAVGVLLVAGAAVSVLAGGGPIGSGFHSSISPRFGLDGLSAFFVVVLCVTALPALLFARDSLVDSPVRRLLAALTGAFILSLLGVLLARDATTFLGFWELMTLVPASAILVARREAAVRRAVFVYLAITHIGGVGVWVAVLLLAQHRALGTGASSDVPQSLVIIAALVGFGTKAGIMPLHVWLPRAHPVAPSHISALMSGVMIKVALYGLIRVVFEWTAPAPRWVGLVLVGFGVLSAVAGVLYALVQRELKRLLAFSSVENVGIITAALGASIVLFADREPVWGTIAFGAALLHVANHAVFKALLFLAAGAFGHATGRLQLDQLGGLIRRMPWTAWSFVIGCTAIAGLPPLNGFVSEWLTLQSLLHVAFSQTPGVSLAGALATAGVAITAALAVFCFVKVVGLVVLGEPRSEQAAAAHEPPLATRTALVMLAAACVGLGAAPGLIFATLTRLAPGEVSAGSGMALRLPGTGSLPTLGVLIALVGLFVILLRVTGSARRAPATPTWACGQLVEPVLQWTSAGFTKPLRLVLEVVYRPRRELQLTESPGGVQRIRYRAEVPHLFDTVIFAPTHRTALRAAAVARRLQSGSLRTYILYLLALLILLLALVRLGGLS